MKHFFLFKKFIVPDGDVPRQCLEEINTADENDTLSACDSIKSESSLEAWLKQIEW